MSFMKVEIFVIFNAQDTTQRMMHDTSSGTLVE